MAKLFLEDVEIGQTENHLLFNVLSSRGDVHMKLDYIGTELHGGLPDDDLERIRKQMNNDFGYAPFDIDVAKATLEKAKSYYF